MPTTAINNDSYHKIWKKYLKKLTRLKAMYILVPTSKIVSFFTQAVSCGVTVDTQAVLSGVMVECWTLDFYSEHFTVIK